MLCYVFHTSYTILGNPVIMLFTSSDVKTSNKQIAANGHQPMIRIT